MTPNPFIPIIGLVCHFLFRTLRRSLCHLLCLLDPFACQFFAAIDQAIASLTQARSQTRDLLQDSPLVAGIAALALGAIVAAVIPETGKEDQLLGTLRSHGLAPCGLR